MASDERMARAHACARRRADRGSATAVVLAALFASGAAAGAEYDRTSSDPSREGPTADRQPTAAAAPEAVPGDLDAVVVTGSRIAVPADESVLPVVTLGAPELERARADSLGDILQALPQALGTQQNTNVNNGGDGSTRLSLRALGAARTLVLLNGRRLPNGGIGGDASVDLNSLPLSMIERVEVLTSGASAVYGADAVAGVVNVITRTAEPGVSARVEHALALEGDGGVLTAQLAGGASLLGGTWMLGLDYVRQDGVKQDQRGYSAAPLSIRAPGAAPSFLGSPIAANGSFQLFGNNPFGLAPGIYTHTGATGDRTAANYRPFTPQDTFNFAPFNYLQTPSERGSAWLLGTRPVGDAELFFEGGWHRRVSSQRLAPATYMTSVGVAPILPNGRPGIPASNWYNPFGTGVGRVLRRFVELDERGFDQRITAWRALVGVRGDLGRWRYEAAAAESRGRADETERGLLAGVRLVPALGPSGPDASGRIVCGTRDAATGVVPQSAIVPGCVPLDLFGGAGSITREMLDYVSVTLLNRGTNRQRYVDLGAEGPWGRLPAGEIRWALGAEYRREAGSVDFDPLRLQGVAGGSGTPLPGGSFTAREAYAEARLPLLADAPLARSLDFVGAVRVADFSSFGSNTTWTAGLHWSPVERWWTRAVYGRVYRAPGIDELYRGIGVATVNFPDTDPCGNSPTPAQRANCAADGVPGGAYVQNVAVGYEAEAGGNPDLQPERGSTLGIGLGGSSQGALALQWSLDWYRIELPGFIASPEGADLLLECAERGSVATCARTERAPDGSLTLLRLVPGNFGRVTTRGMDATGAMEFALPRGDVALVLRASWLDRLDVQPFPGGEIERAAGTYGTLGAAPRWRASANATWELGGLRLGTTLQFIGGYEQCGGPLAATECIDVESATIVDLDASYAFASGVRVYGGLRNAVDSEPPFVNGGAANTEPGNYRVLGRTWFAGVAYRLR